MMLLIADLSVSFWTFGNLRDVVCPYKEGALKDTDYDKRIYCDMANERERRHAPKPDPKTEPGFHLLISLG